MKQLERKIPSNTKPWSMNQYYKYMLMTKARFYVEDNKPTSWDKPSEIMKHVARDN